MFPPMPHALDGAYHHVMDRIVAQYLFSGQFSRAHSSALPALAKTKSLPQIHSGDKHSVHPGCESPKNGHRDTEKNCLLLCASVSLRQTILAVDLGDPFAPGSLIEDCVDHTAAR